MEKIHRRRVFLAAAVILFLIATLAFLLIFQSQRAEIVEAGTLKDKSNETDFEIEKIKIDNVVLSAAGGAIKIRPGQSLTFHYSIYPAYAAETVEKIEFKIVEGMRDATIGEDGVLTVKPTATVYDSIGVQVSIDGKLSNVYNLLIDKIPVQRVKLSANKPAVCEGESIMISGDITPANASFNDVKFEITDGLEYATVDERTGKLKVSDCIRLGSASVTIRGTADGVISNELVLQIYTPTKSLQLTAEDQNPISQVKLITSVSEYASVNDPTITILSGKEFVRDLNGDTLTFKQGISAYKPTVVVRAEQDGLVSEVIIKIRIPLKNLSLSCTEKTIWQGAFLQLDSPYTTPLNATDDIVFKIVKGEEYASITPSGLISVRDAIPVADAKISVRAYCGELESNVLQFDIFVPAERVDLFVNGNSGKEQYLMQGASYPVSVLIGGVSTLQEYRYKVASGGEFAVISGDVLTIKNNITAMHPRIMIYALCGTVRSNTIKINVVIPTVGLEINYPEDVINAGQSLNLMSYKISPSNATNRTILFDIVSGAEYAEIDGGGTITVRKHIPAGNVHISVIARVIGEHGCETIESSIKDFAIYVPTEKIDLSADRYTVKISSRAGGDVILNTTVDAAATENRPTFLIDGKFADYVSVKGNVLTVAKNLTQQMEIPVWAEQDGVKSNLIYISVYPLVEQIQLDSGTETTEVEQFCTYDFRATALPAYAANRSLTYAIDVSESVAVVTEEGMLTVNGNAAVGTKITLTIRTQDCERKLTLTVVAIDIQTVELVNFTGTALSAGETLSIEARINGRYDTSTHFEVLLDGIDTACVTKTGNTLSVKSRSELELLAKNKFSFSIRLRAENSVTSIPYFFTVGVPVEKLTFAGQTPVQRGEENKVGILFNDYNYAYDKGLSLSEFRNIGQESIYYDSMSATFTVKVPATHRAGTVITFKAASKSNPAVSTIVSLTVDALKTSDFSIVYAGEDSQGYEIDINNPQLWAGRKFNFSLLWKDGDPSFLGLSYSYTVTNGSITEIRNAIFSVTPKASGLGMITFDFYVRDGDGITYSLRQPKPIEIFRPAESGGFVYTPMYVDNISIYNADVRNLSKRMDVASGYTKPSAYYFTSQNYNMTLTYDGMITDINDSENYSFLVSGAYYYNGRKVTPGAYRIFSFLPSSSLSATVHRGVSRISTSYVLTPSYVARDTLHLLLIAYQLNKSINLNLAVNLREVNCGYQAFYLDFGYYRSYNVWSKTDYEYGGTGAGIFGIHHPTTTWGSYNPTCKKLNATDLSKLVYYRYVVLSFGASGSGANDWEIRTTTFYFAF